jgi:hypothetical protein
LVLLRNCTSPYELAGTAAVRLFEAILSAQVRSCCALSTADVEPNAVVRADVAAGAAPSWRGTHVLLCLLCDARLPALNLMLAATSVLASLAASCNFTQPVAIPAMLCSSQPCLRFWPACLPA